MVKAVNPPSVYGDSRLKGHEKMGVVHPEGAIIDLAMEDPQISVRSHGHLDDWLVVSTPLKNMTISWGYYSQYMGK